MKKSSSKGFVGFVKYCHMLKQGYFSLAGQRIFLDYDVNLLFTRNKCREIMYPEFYKPLTELTCVLRKNHEVLQLMGVDT